jgi:3-dehydroquinate dehydratase / shikimate dehydrogenase
MAIVVSHIGTSFDALARQALRQAPLADLVELRLDRIGFPGVAALSGFIAQIKKPVIVSVHGPENGGDFKGDLDERFELLHASARAGAAFVDIDWRLSLELGEVEGKCHRIVSRHEPAGTPEDLAAFDEEVRAVLYEGDVIKLVPQAHSTEDGLRVLRHLRTARGGLIAFAGGEAGRFTRILCRLFGSAFTYAAAAALPGQPAPEPTAAGQIRVNDLRGLLPPGGGNAQTAIFGVVGKTLEHSFSPHVHDMALKMARLDALYLSLECDDLARFLALADDPLFRGFSVTAPHKQAAFKLAKERDEASHACRASNTLVRDVNGWNALNTDLPAVRETLETAYRFHREKAGRPLLAQGGPLAGAHVLVLGAGGAARAVVRAAQQAGARATLAGRTPERTAAVARELDAAHVPWNAIQSTEHDVLVNATPVGSAEPGKSEGGPSPIPAEWLRPGTLVLDAVYNPVRTTLLADALARGCTPVPGAEWFVRQAGRQFQAFTRQEPDDAVLRAAFENALGARRN